MSFPSSLAADVPPEQEVHIAGLLVQTGPRLGRQVAAALADLAGVEVHAVDDEGKLVVVCECASSDDVLALIGRIRELPGVLNVALVYQHAESALAMEEEIGYGNDSP